MRAAGLAKRTRRTLSARDSDADLLTEANHRIANSLSLIAAFVRLQVSLIGPSLPDMALADARRLLLEVQVRIETIGRLHRMLAVTGPDDSVDLSERMHDVCTGILSSLASQEFELVEDLAAECRLPADQALTLALIVCEVVTNAVKHAGKGRLFVRSRIDAAGLLLVEVSDEGGGLPDGFDPEVDGGLGFKILRALAKRLGAMLSFQSDDQGLRFRLLMPAPSSGR